MATGVSSSAATVVPVSNGSSSSDDTALSTAAIIAIVVIVVVLFAAGTCYAVVYLNVCATCIKANGASPANNTSDKSDVELAVATPIPAPANPAKDVN